MVRVVKYTYDLTTEDDAVCREELKGCEKSASLHVCFEDGGGAYVCRKCFSARVNEGNWITDSTEILLAS